MSTSGSTAPSRQRFVPRPSKGEERRAKLLTTLERLLVHQPMAEIGVSDITGAAGVTRSAFYFYFATKTAAVGALLDTVLDDVEAASGDDDVTLAGAMGVWRQHPHLFVAMLDAAVGDPEVRAIWRNWLEKFIRKAASHIEDARREGTAPDGPPAMDLARVLVGMNEAAMERDLRRLLLGDPEDENIAATLAYVWKRAVYGA